jgi:hypothetical protein
VGRRVAANYRGSQHIAGSRYRIVAEVVALFEDAWVIDCGILVFRNEPPPTNVTRGSWLSGEAHLGIDPFFYFEELAKRLGMVPLVYAWHVKRILRDAARWIEIAPRTFARDETRPAWSVVEATNAWEDDQPYGASYVLECDRLPQPPKHRRSAGLRE